MKKNNSNIIQHKSFLMKKNNFKNHKFTIRLCERIDVEALKVIIDDFDMFKDDMRESCFADESYDPLYICKKYLDGLNGDVLNASYRYSRKNEKYGRLFVKNGIGLQTLPREIRHTIARDLYDDVDICNCHPVILQHLCNVNNINCENLTTYINNREIILKDLIKNSNITKEEAKKTILSIMNGGVKDYNSINVKPEFLVNIRNEFNNILINLSKIYKEDFEKVKKRNINNGKDFNHEGSFVNNLLCDFENKILMEMLSHLYDRNIINNKFIVLCFDGFMIEKNIINDDILLSIEEHIEKKLNIKIKLKIKGMNDGFDLSDYNLDNNEEYELSDKEISLITEDENKILKLFEDGFTDYDMAKLFSQFYNDFIYYEGMLYHFEGNYWKIYPDNYILHTYLAQNFNKKLLQTYFKYNSKFSQEQLSYYYKNIDKLKFRNRRECLIKDIVSFYTIYHDVFDFKPNLLGFENGVLDINTGEFRQGEKEDYISLLTNFNYEKSKQEDINFLHSFLDETFPILEEKRFFLKVISSSLFGKTLENFIVLTGSGRNGKDTIITNLLKKVLGDYYYLNSVDVLSRKIDSKGTNQTIANMNKKRCIVYNEPDIHTELKNSTIKNITGASEIGGSRALYSKQTTINIQSTHLLLANELPRIDHIDSALYSRLIVIRFRSLFYTKDRIAEMPPDTPNVYQVNPYYKSEKFLNKYKNVFLDILLDSFQEFKKDNYTIDNVIDSVKEENSAYLVDCDNFINWFNENYEKTNEPTDYVKIKDVYDTYRKSPMYLDLSRKERRNNNRKNFLKRIENNPNFRGLFYKQKMINTIKLRSIITMYKNKTISPDFNSEFDI